METTPCLQPVIEGIRFRFVEKNIIGRQHPQNKENLMDIEELQGDQPTSLFRSTEELLNEVLNSRTVKHYRQLRYLSSRHEGDVLKLRFVLSPFSFAFLIKGHEMYHMVLETLDTEEATYVWHVGSKSDLIHEVKKMDNDLVIIRNKGKQVFLEGNPVNFSRVFHDYSEERKGFIIWKGILEEKLV